MFRAAHPLAWSFHRNSSRWSYNKLAPHADRGGTTAFKQYLDRPLTRLGDLDPRAASLAAALRQRRSCRRFSDAPISLSELSTMLWCAYGTLATVHLGPLEQTNRPVPSGGGLYPLEIYPIVRRCSDLEPGIYHFNALHHGVELLRAGAIPEALLTELFLSQPYVAEAACLFVIAAVVERSLWKYEDRGYRYILLEAGHVAQNLNLSAGVLGLGPLNLGGFYDLDLAALLEFDPEIELPLYATAVGVPASDHPEVARTPRAGF